MSHTPGPLPTKLPSFPSDPPTIHATIVFKLLHDFDRYSSGEMLIRFQDTLIEVNNPVTGEKIAEIGGAMGGTWYINIGRRLFVADMEIAVHALLQADTEQYQPT